MKNLKKIVFIAILAIAIASATQAKEKVDITYVKESNTFFIKEIKKRKIVTGNQKNKKETIVFTNTINIDPSLLRLDKKNKDRKEDCAPVKIINEKTIICLNKNQRQLNKKQEHTITDIYKQPMHYDIVITSKNDTTAVTRQLKKIKNRTTSDQDITIKKQKKECGEKCNVLIVLTATALK